MGSVVNPARPVWEDFEDRGVILSIAKEDDDVIAYRVENVLAYQDSISVLKLFESSRIASIFSSSNITSSKCAEILDDFDTGKVIEVIEDDNMDIEKVSEIFLSPKLSADKKQAVFYDMIDKKQYAKVVKIMTSKLSDLNVTSDTTISDTANFYRDINIDSGVNLYIQGYGYLIARTINNSGSIISDWIPSSGASAPAGGGDGGDAGGSLIVFADTFSVGTIKANGYDGGDGSTTSTSSSGNRASCSGIYLLMVSGYSYGSGHTIGGSCADTGGYGGSDSLGGGGGGGGTKDYSGGYACYQGNLESHSTIESLLTRILKSITDYWIENVAGQSLASKESLRVYGGSGGGSGAVQDGNGCGGGGGGCAGEIIIYANNLTAGYIEGKGGNGGNGGNEGPCDCGGAGGNGSIVYIAYSGTLTGSFTYDLSGGNGGGGDYSGDNGKTGVFQVWAV